jgi:hypothetical protein
MEQLDDNALNIYTDGACIPKPRRGGYAWLYVTTGEDGREVVQEYSPKRLVPLSLAALAGQLVNA